ncbi:MAG: hypothetical protein ABSD08_20010 [Xanthobacteraceae bacterium]|jgi:hypothetical protein
MGQRRIATCAIAFTALVLLILPVRSEMGPCRRDGQESSYCGEGEGAARIIPKTTSPSHRLALAWRVTNRPPTIRPNDNDPDLESLIVRIEDGAILAKSRGFYWNLGDRYAPRQYFRAAWSPDSRLLIRTAGRGGVPDSAELFAFTEDDGVIGPFDLVKVVDPAVRAQMKGVKDANEYVLSFSYKPEPTIDDQGLIHASVFTETRDLRDGPIYDLTAQVTRAANSLDAKVLSVSQYFGPSISVTVH